MIIKLMVRSGKKRRNKPAAGVNRQQRRATRAKMRRKNDRFTGDQLIRELERHGIHVGANYLERFFGDFVIGVGRQSLPS